jgi:hypothetical protein
MPLVISHHLLNVFVQLANKRGLKKILYQQIPRCRILLGKLIGTELDKPFSDFGLTLLPIVVARACMYTLPHNPTFYNHFNISFINIMCVKSKAIPVLN